MAKASNGYIVIEVIEEFGEPYIQCYIGEQNSYKFGRRKKIYYDKNGEAYFKINGIKYYINEFFVI